MSRKRQYSGSDNEEEDRPIKWASLFPPNTSLESFSIRKPMTDEAAHDLLALCEQFESFVAKVKYRIQKMRYDENNEHRLRIQALPVSDQELLRLGHEPEDSAVPLTQRQRPRSPSILDEPPKEDTDAAPQDEHSLWDLEGAQEISDDDLVDALDEARPLRSGEELVHYYGKKYLRQTHHRNK